jgi:hypothetical protein
VRKRKITYGRGGGGAPGLGGGAPPGLGGAAPPGRGGCPFADDALTFSLIMKPCVPLA